MGVMRTVSPQMGSDCHNYYWEDPPTVSERQVEVSLIVVGNVLKQLHTFCTKPEERQLLIRIKLMAIHLRNQPDSKLKFCGNMLK